MQQCGTSLVKAQGRKAKAARSAASGFPPMELPAKRPALPSNLAGGGCANCRRKEADAFFSDDGAVADREFSARWTAEVELLLNEE